MSFKNRQINRVVYSFVVADLFHYGHLQLLETAKKSGDLHICGVLSDKAVSLYREQPIADFNERFSVISALKCVDQVVEQIQKNPTENLKKIHNKYPDAVLVLVHGDDWENIPGREFIESIGGELLQPEYYKRLADSRIKSQILTSNFQNFELFTEHFRIDGVTYFHLKKPSRIISTKADTLKHLSPHLRQSRVEETFIFRARDWKMNKNVVLDSIQKQFGGKKIVVRSSAINEDTEISSLAGYFESILNVSSDLKNQVYEAIGKVLDCYKVKKCDNDLNQVLIQRQTPKVNLSGVIFTHKPNCGSPYYTINYDDESGRTDTVTSGSYAKLLTISRNCELEVCPKPWNKILIAVREIEELIPDLALDIEFGIDGNNDVVIYQVRPLVSAYRKFRDSIKQEKQIKKLLSEFRLKYKELKKPVAGELGETTFFSDMAFWNPAEMIGDRCSELAYSLYRYLITEETWNTGLLVLGYTEITEKELMIKFGDKAYIDLRKTFNALLPGKVQGKVRQRLVEGSLSRLQEFPELHDKVEFEVLDSSFLFDFEERRKLYLNYGLNKDEIEKFYEELTKLTANIIQKYNQIAEEDLQIIKSMNVQRQSILSGLSSPTIDASKLIKSAAKLLDACKRNETSIFARHARIAFIAKALLLSLCRKGVLSDEKYGLFFKGLKTIASEFQGDFQKMVKGEISQDYFLKFYGHLRPNTYDINSPRYSNNSSDFLQENNTHNTEIINENISFSNLKNDVNLKNELRKSGLGVDIGNFLTFLKNSLENRENIKFEFSKNISEALELFAQAGEILGISRKELSCLSFDILLKSLEFKENGEITKFLSKKIIEDKSVMQIYEDLVLPSIIFSERDFEFISQLEAKPNYVTKKSVEGQLIYIDSLKDQKKYDLIGKIVLIESADPGFDWIFTKNIIGLITRFGGIASHMAIRCAEFELPAAIGCGDYYFNSLKDASVIRLDCQSEKIKITNKLF